MKTSNIDLPSTTLFNTKPLEFEVGPDAEFHFADVEIDEFELDDLGESFLDGEYDFRTGEGEFDFGEEFATGLDLERDGISIASTGSGGGLDLDIRGGWPAVVPEDSLALSGGKPNDVWTTPDGLTFRFDSSITLPPFTGNDTDTSLFEVTYEKPPFWGLLQPEPRPEFAFEPTFAGYASSTDLEIVDWEPVPRKPLGNAFNPSGVSVDNQQYVTDGQGILAKPLPPISFDRLKIVPINDIGVLDPNGTDSLSTLPPPGALAIGESGAVIRTNGTYFSGLDRSTTGTVFTNGGKDYQSNPYEKQGSITSNRGILYRLEDGTIGIGRTNGQTVGDIQRDFTLSGNSPSSFFTGEVTADIGVDQAISGLGLIWENGERTVDLGVPASEGGQDFTDDRENRPLEETGINAGQFRPTNRPVFVQYENGEVGVIITETFDREGEKHDSGYHVYEIQDYIEQHNASADNKITDAAIADGGRAGYAERWTFDANGVPVREEVITDGISENPDQSGQNRQADPLTGIDIYTD